MAKKGVLFCLNTLFASKNRFLSLIPHTLIFGELNFPSVYISSPSILFSRPSKLLNPGLPPRKYSFSYPSKLFIMVCCFKACGLRVENLESCTSGIPVVNANNPLAVEKCGVKHFSKKIPCFVSSLKYGVVLSGLPLMLLLYMLKDSHNTSTTFGLLSNALDSGKISLRYENSDWFLSPIHSVITGKYSLALFSLYWGFRNFSVVKKFCKGFSAR